MHGLPDYSYLAWTIEVRAAPFMWWHRKDNAWVCQIGSFVVEVPAMCGHSRGKDQRRVAMTDIRSGVVSKSP